MDDVEMLNAKGAAHFLGISRALFFQKAAEYRRTAGKIGFGPAHYVSRRTVLYSKSALRRCMARYARGATQEPAA